MTVINTNGAALRAQNGGRLSELALRTAMDRLSTGKRINSAKDDAAGLAIANAMTAEIRGKGQAIRNANDGISLAQTADGALGEAVNMLHRIRELAVQSANGTYSDANRVDLQSEVAALGTQINQLIANTWFNGVTLFDTSDRTFPIQTGARAGEQVNIVVKGFDLSAATASDVSTVGGAQAVLGTVDSAVSAIVLTRATLGAGQSRLESVANAMASGIVSLSDSRSRIEDADYAVESTNLARAQILSQASTAMLSQASQSPKSVLNLLQ